MLKSHKFKTQSRRQVQRRFPPGTFFLYDKNKLGMIVGWAPVAADINPKTGFVRSTATWEVLVLKDNSRIVRHRWEWVQDWLTLEEWEQLE